MHIVLFGATGGTGNQLLQQALAAGHTVTALVRSPAKLTITNNRLHVIAGDVLSEADVDAAMADADAVIVSLGKSSNNPDDIVSRGTANIINAMQNHDVRRLLVITSLGVGDSRDQVPLTFKLVAATVLRSVMHDKEKQEEIVRTSNLDWTIIRPGGLTDGPATGQYVAGLDKSIKAGQISRADVAAFVLQQLDGQAYLHAAPAIT